MNKTAHFMFKPEDIWIQSEDAMVKEIIRQKTLGSYQTSTARMSILFSDTEEKFTKQLMETNIGNLYHTGYMVPFYNIIPTKYRHLSFISRKMALKEFCRVLTWYGIKHTLIYA